MLRASLAGGLTSRPLLLIWVLPLFLAKKKNPSNPSQQTRTHWYHPFLSLIYRDSMWEEPRWAGFCHKLGQTPWSSLCSLLLTSSYVLGFRRLRPLLMKGAFDDVCLFSKACLDDGWCKVSDRVDRLTGIEGQTPWSSSEHGLYGMEAWEPLCLWRFGAKLIGGVAACCRWAAFTSLGLLVGPWRLFLLTALPLWVVVFLNVIVDFLCNNHKRLCIHMSLFHGTRILLNLRVLE